MTTYAMCIDLTTCVACDACVIACKDENNVPDGHARDWTEEYLSGKYPDLRLEQYSNRCQHCENAPCVPVCPATANYYQDGLVLIDRDKCIECTHCIPACPYGARYRDVGKWIDKCTFCDHRIGTGRSTACVEVCPTSSLVFGDIDDPNSEISKLLATRKYRVLKPEKQTKPKYFLLESIIEKEELNIG